ncbi:hypothetical protein KEM55_000768 [Ascosphaera atra]|nr:hypothetical protein KEM55_000768 [Ascosphaera atra]
MTSKGRRGASNGRGPRGGRGKQAVRFAPQSTTSTSASAPSMPRVHRERGAPAQQGEQEKQQQGQQGPVTPAQLQLPPQHTQSAPQPNLKTPAHLLQGYRSIALGRLRVASPSSSCRRRWWYTMASAVSSLVQIC